MGLTELTCVATTCNRSPACCFPFRPNYTAMLAESKRLCIGNMTRILTSTRASLPRININSSVCRSVEHALHVDRSKSVILRHSCMIFLPPRRRDTRALMSNAETEALYNNAVLCVFSVCLGEIMLSRMMMVMCVDVGSMECWW